MTDSDWVRTDSLKKENNQSDSDWVPTESINKNINQQNQVSKIPPLDFVTGLMSGDLLDPERKLQRTLGQRIVKAPFKAGDDLLNLIKSTPQLLTKAASAVTSLPSAVSSLTDLNENSLKTWGRGLYGAAEKMQPSSFGKMAEHYGLISPEENKAIPSLPKLPDIEQTPGEKAGENLLSSIPEILTGKALIQKGIKATKLRSKDLAEDIVNTEKSIKDKYSGPKGLYTKHFEKARKEGYGGFEFLEPEKLNIEKLKRYTSNPDKHLEELNKFNSNPTLENAQAAISELGYIIRPLKDKRSLPPHKSKQLDAALEAQQHIQQAMFTDKTGKFSPELYKEHSGIQKGYATEYIPYKMDKNIQKYKAGKLRAKKLIPKLAKSQFVETRGEAHPQIERQQAIKKGLKTYGLPSAITMGITAPISYYLIKKLLKNANIGKSGDYKRE